MILQPWSVRHFRVYQNHHLGGVEATALATYIDRNMKLNSTVRRSLNQFSASLRNEIVGEVSAGTEVIIRNLQSRPDLNGLRGRVLEHSAETCPTGRVAIWVEEVEQALSLKVSCICPVSDGKQYLSHEELFKYVTKFLSSRQPAIDPNLSARDEAVISNALCEDADVYRALQYLGSGNVCISAFEDANLARGFKKLTLPPLDKVVDCRVAGKLRGGVEVGEHGRAKEVFGLLKILRTGKRKALEADGSLARGDGVFMVRKGSEHSVLLEKVAKKIEEDAELYEVFEKMEKNGEYRNPVRQLQRLDDGGW